MANQDAVPALFITCSRGR